MTHEEYIQKKRKIVDSCLDEIDEHESAGCYGDAENCRKWMQRELEALDKEYRCGRQR